jgi:hypothetical protein
MKKLSLAFTCLLLCLVPLLALAQQKTKPDKVISVTTVQGRTLGFQMGDYQHVDIRRTNGRRKSFFIFKGGLDYFLAIHKDSLVTYTYQVADVDLPESGGMTRVERLVSAKVGNMKFETWWKKVRAENSIEQLDNKYGPLVRKYEVKP